MNKTARRISAAALAVFLSLCLGTGAVAEESPTDTTVVEVTKVYQLVGDGTSPAETFRLEQIGGGTVDNSDVKSVPDLGSISNVYFEAGAATAEGSAAAFSIELPEYTAVGVYEYVLREVGGNTAGVEYFSGDIRLVVTVVNDDDGTLRVAAVHTEDEGGEKSDHLTNTYSAGTLSIVNDVEGNLGNKDKYFTYEVTLQGKDGKVYGYSYKVTGGSSSDNPTNIKVGDTKTFYLKDGDTVSIENLPYGVTYTVTQAEADGYATTSANESGTVNGASVAASFTNSRAGTPDTGVSLDSLPYVLTLATAVLGAAALALGKHIARNR